MTSGPETGKHARGALRLVAWIGIVLALGVGAGVVFVVRYQPLSTANFAPWFCDGCIDLSTGQLVYQEGRQVAMGTSLINNGQLPVRITGLSFPADPYETTLLEVVHVDMAKPGAGGQTAPGDPALQPFEPFTLGPGEDQAIVLRASFTNCEAVPAGAATRWWRVEVAFTVLGAIPRHQTVELPDAYEVFSPAKCPGRA